MHVAQLFDALTLRPDIKIVEAALPDFSRDLGPREFRVKTALSVTLGQSCSAQDLVSEALL
jgi:hypothetical protein